MQFPESFFNLTASLYMRFIRMKNTVLGIVTTRVFVAFLLLLGAFLIYIVGYQANHNTQVMLSVVLNDFYVNLSSELVGIMITVLLIDTFSAIRQTRQEKESLALQMASPNNMFALEAIRILKSKGWHRDGTLWHRNLHYANLAHADLVEVEFRQSILRGANLSDTDCSATHFGHCNLYAVDFENANLTGTVFFGADLSEANLRGVLFIEHKMDENTILPDGSKWSYQADLSRFVDPEHPHFWRSKHSNSPAFQQNKDN